MDEYLESKNGVTEKLRDALISRSDVHAFWLEGSSPQGFADEYSDIDLWLSVDDDKIFTIYDVIEETLTEIAPIDFKYVVKNKGELGQTVYHLSGMNEFFTVDINTQGISRDVYLVKGIDDAEVVFDKQNVVKFMEREPSNVDIDAKRAKLRAFYEQMRPSVVKNVRRGKKLEALYYYHLILRYATKFLRLKHGMHDKVEYDLKHVYRDLPEQHTNEMERLYSIGLDEIEQKLPELKEWIRSL